MQDFMDKIFPILIKNYKIIIVIVVTIVLTFKFASYVESYKKNRRSVENRRKGNDGESKAIKYLESHGFKIIAETPKFKYHFLLNGERKNFEIQPDIIASRDGEEWVIEVKNGNHIGINHAETRRQVREYAFCLPEMRCGFFDASKGEFSEISFSDHDFEEARCNSLFTFFAGVITAIILCLTVFFVKGYYK